MYQTRNLINSLDRVANALASDADRIRAFVKTLEEAPEADLVQGFLGGNVVTLLGQVLNNSGWISAAESAIASAYQHDLEGAKADAASK